VLTTGLKQFGRELLGHFGRVLTSTQYRRERREIKRLRELPRYQPGETSLLDPPVRFVDAASFLVTYEQIFVNQAYRLRPKRSPARIIDCGANIGLSVLYFKRLDPSCRIVAFEPDPRLFAALSENCARHGLRDVESVNSAVWTHAGTLPFWSEGSDAGRLVDVGAAPAPGGSLEVSAVRLRDVLGDAPVDLLKLDVEGAEAEVLLDCADRLDAVDHLFVEYHSMLGRPQRLDEMLRVLRSAGFRVHVQPELVSPAPFLERRESWGMDQRLNLYAYRP